MTSDTKWRPLTNSGYYNAITGIEEGTMHSIEAIGRMCSDRDFLAACDLHGLDYVEAARKAVARWRAFRLPSRTVE